MIHEDIKTNNTKVGESSGIVRNLKKEAAENWKNTHLASEDAVTWLIVNADKRGNVQSLNCMVFKKYTPQVEGMRNFSQQWAHQGSMALQISNARKHANREPHREAMRLHYKESGKDAQELQK